MGGKKESRNDFTPRVIQSICNSIIVAACNVCHSRINGSETKMVWVPIYKGTTHGIICNLTYLNGLEFIFGTWTDALRLIYSFKARPLSF